MIEDSESQTSIAVVGLAGRFPGAEDIDELWKNLKVGKVSTTFPPDAELIKAGVNEEALANSNYVKATIRLEGIDLFDASFFGYSEQQAASIDPQQRLFLECAWEAIERAGYDVDKCGPATGVFAGAGTNGYILRGMKRASASRYPADVFQARLDLDKDSLTTRVSYKLNLQGPSVAVQTACSSSLVAVHLACQSLLNFECDMALAGGVSLQVPQGQGYIYDKGGILSPDGYCRAYDANANGTVTGSGVAIVALKRLADSIHDGDLIHAVIRGSAINNDGSRKVGYSAPGLNGQSRVIAMALASAGLDPRDIGLIEGHGTGTAIGDAIELTALTDVFAGAASDARSCVIGSIKANIGHLDAAAGVAGLVKAILCLKNRAFVPSASFNEANEVLRRPDNPFCVNTKFRPWERGLKPRYAGVSSFGIGGTNAHVILQEPPDRLDRTECSEHHLVPLSADNAGALVALARSVAKAVINPSTGPLADVAYTLQLGRKRFSHRQYVVAKTMEDLAAALSGECSNAFAETEAHDQMERPVVFMFSGQSLQRPGIVGALYQGDEHFRRDVDDCVELFRQHLDLDLRAHLCGLASKEPTGNSGPTVTGMAAPFVIEYCLAKHWMRWGLKPVAILAYGIGEYAAACISEVLTLKDGIELVAARGDILASSSRPVPPAGLHEAEAVNVFRSDQALAATDAASRINFHSPNIPIGLCSTGRWITDRDELAPSHWASHSPNTAGVPSALREVVNNTQQIFLEMGPGELTKLLGGGYAGNDKDRVVIRSLDERLDNDRPALLRTLGRLWLRGATIDWARFHSGQQRNRVELPSRPLDRRRHWVEEYDVADVSLEHTLHRRAGRRFYIPSWKISLAPLSGIPKQSLRQAISWLVLVDRIGLGDALVNRLRADGSDAIAVEEGESYAEAGGKIVIDSTDAGSYHRLFLELKNSGRKVDRVIFCWGLTKSGLPASDLDAGLSPESTYVSFIHLLKAMLATDGRGPESITVVTNQVYNVGGEEVCRPERAAIPAICTVFVQEVGTVSCAVVDLPQWPSLDAIEHPYARYVKSILAEASNVSGMSAVAYRGGLRMTRAFEPVEFDGLPVRRLRQGGAYIVTGGVGKIGLALADYLGRQFKAKLLLISRPPFPDISEWETWIGEHGPADPISIKIRELQAICATGAEIRIAALDVSDARELRRAIDAAEQCWGCAHGVFHLAAETGGRSIRAPLSELDCADFEAQMRPKVRGFCALDSVLRERPLDFGVVFSSTAAILGGLGFGAYAAANAVLDSVATGQMHPGAFEWIAINWDGWLVPGMQRTRPTNATDPYAITVAEGLDALKRIISSSTATQIIASSIDLDARVETWVRRRSRVTQVGFRPTEESRFGMGPSAGDGAPRSDLERTIAGIWREVLGCDRINVSDNFLDLGGDSLIALRVVERVREMFGVEVSLEAFVAASCTIATLAIEVVSQLAALQGVTLEQIEAVGRAGEGMASGSS